MDESLSGRLTMIVLPDADGREIRLGSLWATQPAGVLDLGRGMWTGMRISARRLGVMRTRESCLRRSRRQLNVKQRIRSH